MRGRTLDYCALRSLVGREVANEMFSLRIPDGIDMDHPGDQAMVDGIVRDNEQQFERCWSCPDLDRCDPPV